MADVKSGLDTIDDITKITNFIPVIGQLIATVIETASDVRQTFNQAFNKVQEIDSEVYRYRSVAIASKETGDKGIYKYYKSPQVTKKIYGNVYFCSIFLVFKSVATSLRYLLPCYQICCLCLSYYPSSATKNIVSSLLV
mgnify:CR=1 FL=1